MKVIKPGITKSWKPETVNCSMCKAVFGDIEIKDLEPYSYEDGMQWDTYTVWGVKVACPECGNKIVIPDVPSVIIAEARKQRVFTKKG